MADTAETQPYEVRPAGNDLKTGSRASYTPSAAIDPFAYGVTTASKAAVLGTVPEVASAGTVEVPVPAMPGTLRVGDDKNVSTPVSG